MNALGRNQPRSGAFCLQHGLKDGAVAGGCGCRRWGLISGRTHTGHKLIDGAAAAHYTAGMNGENSNIAGIADRIRPVLSRCDVVVAAYLFGSAASGLSRPASDIDIAVLLAETVPVPSRKALLDYLLSPLCRTLRGDVHLLFLNDASYLARSQVFAKGRLLYVSNPKQLALFRMKATALFADFAPCMRMTREGLQNRLRYAHGR